MVQYRHNPKIKDKQKMALMQWDDEEKKKDESDIRKIASVQSGWQPSPSGANSDVATDGMTSPGSQPQGSYLVSDEKAQVDQRKIQRDAQIAEARRMAAAQAAISQEQQVTQQPEQQNLTPVVDPNIAIAQEKRATELREQLANENKGIGGLFNGFKDRFFDANSTQDRLNRVNDGAPEMYQDQQELTARDNVQSVATNPLKRIYEEATEAPRRVAYALQQATGQADATREAYESKHRGEDENIAKAKQIIEDPTVDYEKRLRWYNWLVKAVPEIAKSRALEENQMQKDAKSGDGVATAAALAEMGVDIATLGLGGKIAAQTAKLGVRGVRGSKLLEPVLSGTVGGGLGSVTSQGRDVTPQQVALGAGAGGALGGVLPLAGAGTGRILRPFKPGELNVDKAVSGAIGDAIDPANPNVPGRSPDITPVIDDAATNAAGTVSALEVGDSPRISTGDTNSTPVRDSNTVKTNTPETVRVDNPNAPIDYGNPSTPFTSKEYDLLNQLNEQKSFNELSPEMDAIRQKLQTKKDGITQTPEVTPEVTPVPKSEPRPVAPAVADGTAKAPVLPTEQVKALQDSIPGKSQAEEAVINQKIQELDPDTPSVKAPVESNLPEGMSGAKKKKKTLTPEQQGDKNFSERFQQASGNPKDLKTRLARSLDMGKDDSIDIAELTKGMKPKAAARVNDIYSKIEEIYKNSAATAKANRKNFVEGKEVDLEANRKVSSETSERGVLESKLISEIRALNRKGDIPERIVQTLENIVQYRTANMLNSASVIEKAAFGDIGANIMNAIKNPIKQARGMTKQGNIIKSGIKASTKGLRVAPKNASEAAVYLTGNTLKVAFTPVEIAARSRRGALRTELTQWANKAITGRDLTMKQAENLSRTASNHTEMLVSMGAGVDNFMVSATQFNKALKSWKKFMESGSDADLVDFEKIASAQGTLANKLTEGFKKSGNKNKGARALASTANALFPFVRVAYNAANTGITKTLNPFSKSVVDSIRADQRGLASNAVKILQNKLVDYGILGGAAALAGGGLLIYNNGDEVDQPRGWSLKVDEDTFIPVRATPIEFPLAVAGATREIINDVKNDDLRDVSYYVKMVGGSLPYLDQLEQNTKVWDSIMNLGGKDGDGGYAAKSYATNLARSLTPYSNNSIMPVVERFKGNSVNAKSTYDKDSVWQTYKNSLKSGYNIDRDSLKDSLDAAGRTRTVENQGAFINKTINNKSTAEFNDRITALVEFGRKNGYGDGTQDMFNTFDDGDNNNFKTVEGTIWAVTGKEGSETKLKKHDKLSDLSQQIRSGFYDGTGTELLTIGDQNLYSDVSMPNSTGTKNSSKPINMQSITNAIAATDLPEEERTRMYEISQKVNGMYEKVKSKEMTYEQYQAGRADLETEYTDILRGSESYQKMSDLFDELDGSGFFDADGLGSTRSGQTFLWKALNTLLGSKGKTPAADYPKDKKDGWGSGGGSGIRASNKPGDRGSQGIKWSPVQARQIAKVKKGTYTPFKATVRLGNAVKKDKTQNYASRSF
jgi:hypothetical protein